MIADLTVQESQDGRFIKIKGTRHSLDLVSRLLTEVLEPGGTYIIEARHPTAGVSVIVERTDQ